MYSLSDDSYAVTPVRGERFDWLYDEWIRQGVLDRLRKELAWPRPAFWREAARNNQHDERAAIVCATTAVAVLCGRYVAVGEPLSGYFFFPPWSLWEPWAKRALDANRRDQRLPRAAEVWIDGGLTLVGEELPQ